MKDCAQCGKPVDGDQCQFCSARAKGAGRDPMLCAAEGCQNRGSVSASLKGGGFYCRDHLPEFQAFRDGIPCPPPMGFQALRNLSRPKRMDAEAVAERLAIANE